MRQRVLYMRYLLKLARVSVRIFEHHVTTHKRTEVNCQQTVGWGCVFCVVSRQS